VSFTLDLAKFAAGATRNMIELYRDELYSELHRQQAYNRLTLGIPVLQQYDVWKIKPRAKQLDKSLK